MVGSLSLAVAVLLVLLLAAAIDLVGARQRLRMHKRLNKLLTRDYRQMRKERNFLLRGGRTPDQKLDDTFDDLKEALVRSAFQDAYDRYLESCGASEAFVLSEALNGRPRPPRDRS